MGFASTKLPKSLTELKTRYVEMNALTIEIVLNVHCFFNDYKKTNLWLITKNPYFGGIAPLKLIQLGKGKKVLRIVQNLLDGDLP